MPLSQLLLDILACPACKGPVRLSDHGLVCDACRLLYPVRDGILVMLAEKALPLDEPS